MYLSQDLIKSYNDQHLEELWTVPWNTYHVATIDGIKLYTSSGLRDNFCQVMSKHNRTNKISGKIRYLVDKNKMMPVWLNKGLFSLSIFKIFAPVGSKAIAGFYAPKADQIYLLMDNNITFGFASNTVLADLLMHESMHMAAAHLKGRFNRIFEDELINYYSALFKNLFNIDKNIDNESRIFCSFLFKEFEYKMGNLNSSLKKYTELVITLFKDKTGLKFDDFQQLVTEYITFIKIYLANIDVFISVIKKYNRIYTAMKLAYINGLKVRNDKSLCIQELIYPSEVIAMYSELAKPGSIRNVYRAFNGIK